MPPPRDADVLRSMMQQLFRRFGVLAAGRTPCGQPLPIAHAHALMVLQASGELSQQALGAQLGIDKSNVARLCAKLVAAGHATQRTAPDDARSRRVSLTAQGRRLARTIEAASGARFGALLGAVPTDRRGQVLESLQLLLTALDQLPATPSAPRNP